MLFAKLWGGRKEEGDEPARFAVAQTPRPAASQSPPRAAKRPSAPAKKGFDPYNSGSFERKNAWERISKR